MIPGTASIWLVLNCKIMMTLMTYCMILALPRIQLLKIPEPNSKIKSMIPPKNAKSSYRGILPVPARQSCAVKIQSPRIKESSVRSWEGDRVRFLRSVVKRRFRGSLNFRCTSHSSRDFRKSPACSSSRSNG